MTNNWYFNKKFWSTTFTLTGTIIGAGILGLPYVISRVGILIGIIMIILLGLLVLYIKLCLGEITLRTKGDHQLPGYAKKYLGIWGERIMFFSITFGVYISLIAYLIGEGESLSLFLTGSSSYAIYFVFGFWLLMSLLLHQGLKGLRKIETWGVLAIIIIILSIAIYYFPSINFSNYAYSYPTNIMFPFGVIIFAFLGFACIPELRIEIKGSKKNLKKAIIIGVAIPMILYITFCSVFIGVLGQNITEVATLSFGNGIKLLGIFTMLTSYFVLTFSLKDIYDFDLHMKHFDFIFVSLLPLLFYLILYAFNMLNFIKILGIGGTISGGFTAIIALVMHLKSKKSNIKKPEYTIYNNWFITIMISIIFIIGMFYIIFS